MRLFLGKPLRRLVSLAVILFFAIPFGLSVSGCHKALPVDYCDAGDSGPIVGQVASILLSPALATTGESLSFGQIGQSLSASAQDCKGNSVSVRSYTYASSNLAVADINPATGQVCAGTWNRNSGAGVPDFTTCSPFTTAAPAQTTATINFTPSTTPTATTGATTTLTLNAPADTVSGILVLAVGSNPPHTVNVLAGTTLAALATQITSDNTFKVEGISALLNTTTGVLTISGPMGTSNTLFYTGSSITEATPAFLAYVTATANGATSNAIPVYIHPVVTGIVLGNPSTCAVNSSGAFLDPATTCCPANTSTTYTPKPGQYLQNSCVSQGQSVQLVARVYQNGTTNPADNITCQVGHLTFGASTSSTIVTIDENGVATANQPGSSTITASVASSSSASSAGFFSTCPPTSITLSVPGQPTGTSAVNVAVNNTQPLTATVKDINGTTLTGVDLEYISSTPTTVTPSGSSLTPTFPGVANITAVCQPGTCNPAPFSQVGYLGNGAPLTSNPITVTTAGTSSTVLYMGSTSSLYLMPIDFSTGLQSSLIKLPYVPNSMVISNDGSTIYMGSTQGLMTVSTAANSQGSPNLNVPGVVLSVSPDGTTLVITDPVRQTVSLYSTGGSQVSTLYGGVGTRAAWSPDSQTVYITLATGNTLLTHSNFTNWQTTATGEVYTDVVSTVPSEGAYFAGTSFTDGRSYCPSGAVISAGPPETITNTFAPLADEKAVTTDRLAATDDGKHILGATATSPASLADLDITLPSQLSPVNGVVVPSPCPAPPAPVAPGYFQSTVNKIVLTRIAPTQITGVVPSSSSTLAFVTYAGTSGQLPYYVIPATGAGTVGYLQLGNGATTNAAPVSGAFSTDNTTFYVGTSGASGSSVDNDVHIISITGGTTPAETGILSPNLPAASGTGPYAPVNLLVQRPKRITS